MKAPEHLTRGEWVLRQNIVYGPLNRNIRRGICTVHTGQSSDEGLAAEANARFIAGSKQMAEALNKLMERAHKLNVSPTHDGLDNCIALADARLALLNCGYTDELEGEKP